MRMSQRHNGGRSILSQYCVRSLLKGAGIFLLLLLSSVMAIAGLDERHSVEREIRSQLANTLIPVVGAGNFIVTVKVSEQKKAINGGSEEDIQQSVLVNKDANIYDGLYPLGKIGVWSEPKFKVNKKSELVVDDKFEVGQIKVDLFLDAGLSPQQKADAKNVTGVYLSTFGDDKVTLTDYSIALNLTKKKEERESLRLREEMEARLRKAANLDEQKFRRAALKAELDMKRELALELEKIKAEARKKEREEDLARERSIASIEKTPIDHLSEFQLPIGLLGSALILFVLGVFALFRYQKFAERKMVLMEEAAKRAESDAIHKETDVDHAAIEEVAVQSEMTEQEVADLNREFSRFSMLCEDELSAGVTLVRQWIQSDKRESKSILALLPRFVDMKKVNAIIHHLNSNERKLWSKIVGKPRADISPDRVIEFLSVQMTNSVLVPMEVSEDGSVELLLGLNSEEAAEVIRRNPEFAKIVLNVLPTSQVAGILRILEQDQLEYGAGTSLTFSKDDLVLSGSALRETVQQVLQDTRQVTSPFLDQIPQLIREVGPETEGPLFRVLSEANLSHTLVEISREVFPSELIFELGDGILKRILEQMPLRKRAELFISQDDTVRDHFMQILGAGSKLAEIMTTEIQDIEADSNKVTLLKADAVRKWRDFVRLARNFIRANESVRGEVRTVVDKWLVEKMGIENEVVQKHVA